jgi:eukaryotic-like serine/threonine-protein kinase
MEGYRDLHMLVLALRGRVIDPGRLADAVGDWDDRANSGLMSFLADRGVISPDELHRLESVATKDSGANPRGDAALEPTQDPTGNTDATIDFPSSGFPAVTAESGERYKVIRLHKSGGLGKVWLARDNAIGRDVALKTIRPERASEVRTRARFVREARVTGQLEHPSIVPLYDLAGDGADPFYVMRFVTGRTLAETAADYHRRRAEGKAGPLDLNTLLDAFVSVCRAVAFAHSRNVLHRDLKGQNIVVGEYGEVFLLDWGLAKSLGESDDAQAPGAEIDGDWDGDMTAPGSSIGTPAYMAPEVAAGSAATKASDVYGLGAILYALLVGRSPYAGPTAVEVVKKVTTTDPIPVAIANPFAPPALAAICRRAMARDPQARYPSADELAIEVRRWLADEPVTAYREPWTARVTRWARRRKTTVVAAGVLLLTTAVAATAAVGLVWREQRQTDLAWKQAEAEKVKATENAETAIEVVRDLSQYAQMSEPSGGRSASDQERKDALATCLASYERLLALYPDDAGVRENVARMHRYRANLSRLLNETAEAEKSYREASRHYGELAATHPEVSRHREDAALTSRDHSVFLKSLGRLKEATNIMDDSIRLYEELRRASPDESSYQRILANMLIDRSEMDFQLGLFADSERSARRSAELYANLAETPSAEPETLDPLFRCMTETGLGIALRELGRIDEALAVHDAVIERLAGLTKLSASRDLLHQYHRARAERGWTLARVPDRYAAGLAGLDSAILGWEQLAKQFPQIPIYLREQGVGNLYRGRLKVLLGRRDAAVQDLTAAAKIYDGLVEKYQDIPAYRSGLGQAYMRLGQLAVDPKEAAEWYRKARNMLETAAKRNPENVQDRQALAELNALTKWKP